MSNQQGNFGLIHPWARLPYYQRAFNRICKLAPLDSDREEDVFQYFVLLLERLLQVQQITLPGAFEYHWTEKGAYSQFLDDEIGVLQMVRRTDPDFKPTRINRQDLRKFRIAVNELKSIIDCRPQHHNTQLYWLGLLATIIYSLEHDNIRKKNDIYVNLHGRGMTYHPTDVSRAWIVLKSAGLIRL